MSGLTHHPTLRTWARHLRRHTLLGPLLDAWWIRDVLRHLPGDIRRLVALGPHEFVPYIRSLATAWDSSREQRLAFDVVLLRQDQLAASAPGLLAALAAAYRCVHSNPQYAVFVPAPALSSSAACADVMQRLEELTHGRALRAGAGAAPFDAGRAILVTTFNRPAALRRSLPQLAALGPSLLVVDDGSSPEAARHNRAICLKCGAQYLLLPGNRGLSSAINVGLDYLLADQRLSWISYFQDDVDVDPAMFERMRAVEDPAVRPIVTGYDADEHATVREEIVGGVRVRMKRSSPGVHLHAHVDYWSRVRPIPTLFLGSPRRRWGASEEDYWIVNEAPGSAGRQGLLIPCIPGLVRTFLWHHADSTWGNPNQPDGPLACAQEGGR